MVRGIEAITSVDAQIEVPKSTAGNGDRASHEAPGRPMSQTYPKHTSYASIFTRGPA